MVEGLGPRGALGRSWALTRGKFWRSFAVAFVLFVIRLIVVLVPSYVIQFITLFTAADLPLPSAIGTFVTALIAAFYVPLTSAAYLVLYYDLRVRKENLDLDQRVGQLESELQPDEEQPS